MKNNPNIKNIIFDIGNVLVKWEPYEVIRRLFPKENPQEFYKKMQPIWIDLNLGKLSEEEATPIYTAEFKTSEDKIRELFYELKKNQTFIPGSIELLQKLDKLGFHLYSITDNIKEIIQYHQNTSNFLSYFKGIIASCNVGILKPDERIFKALLFKYKLNPAESIFIDDLERNVEGAKAVGIHAIQFTDSKSCTKALREYGINI